MTQMRDVSIIGIGRTDFRTGGNFIDLGGKAIKKALKDTENLDKEEIELAYCARSFNMPMNAGQTMLLEVEMLGIGAFNVENGFTTGATALKDAYYDVAAGINDMVMVAGSAGVDEPGSLITHSAGQAWDVRETSYPPYEAMFAKLARAHMEKYGTTREELAAVGVKNRNNGSLNPHAFLKNKVTEEEVLNSKTIVDPLTEYMCSPLVSGAVAFILCPTQVASYYNDQPIRIAGCAMTSGKPGMEFLESAYDPITRAAMESYGMAKPFFRVKDIDVAQVYDLFSIRELIAYEALGFCKKGEGGKWIKEGSPMLDGELPVNTDGGLMANGLSLGGSTLAQSYELVLQLRGKAGDRQVPDAKWALQECGGSGGSGFCGGIGGIGFGTGGSYFVNIFTNE